MSNGINRDQMKNIAKDLNLTQGHTKGQKILLYNKSSLEETELNLMGGDKVNFNDLMTNFDMPTILNEASQTKFKSTLKDFVKNKEKNKVTIKFDDTETKALERTTNYDKLSKEITKYQAKVKINREADVLDFTQKEDNHIVTAKSLVQDTKDLNEFEKSIKEALVKNKYDTDEKILEKENKMLASINPEEMKQRYDELKKIRKLVFQKEMDHKRKSKIKSKLYHKIKKKQKEREENHLLSQLEEVDPEGVKKFLDKKKLDRIKERIELKHSFNSKFNKTVKRYNLHKDENVKEAIKENFKLRDELLRKIKGQENDEEEQDSEEENLELDENSEEAEEDENQKEVEEDKLLLNFNEDENIQNETKLEDKGVWGMNFMKKAENNMNTKLREVLNEVDASDEEMYFSEDEVENKKTNRKVSESEEESDSNKKTNDLKLNARKKNVLQIKTNESGVNSKKNNKSKITSEILEELNDDAKLFVKDSDMKLDLNEADLKRLITYEQINEDEELFSKFLIQNYENKKEFLEESKEKPISDSNLLSGWGSWAGDSKSSQTKDFLRKKRQQDLLKRKEQISSTDTKSNPAVKVNYSFDKKFTNYMVKELPHNVKSQEEFEKVNNTAFGREWNSLTMYKKLIQPNVVKKIGQIIEPMRINDTTSAKKLCEIIEKATKKKQRTKAKI